MSGAIRAAMAGPGAAEAAAGTSVTGPSPVASFAHGGPVFAGRPVKVHANELFIPPVNGRILTAAQSERFGRSGGGVVVNLINNSSAEVSQGETTTGPDGEEPLNFIIANAVARNLRPGTATFRAMGAVFGSRQQLIGR